MKILKIENEQGYFYSFSTNQYKTIDLIDKEALLSIVDYVLSNDDAEADPFVEDMIKNNVQIIVYKEISSKVCDLILKREAIINSVNTKYVSAIEKYKQDSEGIK